MQLLYTILYGLQRIKGERTASSIYHLLKGKRSSQTLQDGAIYRLSFLFGVYKKLNRHVYDEQIQLLLNENCIEQIQENTYAVTAKGEDRLAQYGAVVPFPMHLEGLRYGDTGEVLWKRLSLVVQSLSHLQRNSSSFLPIQQDIEVTEWVKRFFLSALVSRTQLAAALYEECMSALSALTEAECTVFVLRLSGYHRVGYTEGQIAEMLDEDSLRIHFQFLSALHWLTKQGLEEDGRYPLLSQMTSYKEKRVAVLSLSTIKTYDLWKQGKTIAETVRIRGLKRSTIEDHIVEIALHEPDFPIESFLAEDKVKRITETIQRMNTRRLRELKKYTGDDVSYFDIRLVLARIGGANED